MADDHLSQVEQNAWQHILAEQAARRPQWQLQDVYKLIYQASLGSEHAAPSVEAARRWLEDEIACLGDGPSDPDIEPISPDGQLVRVNLRPYLAADGRPEALLAAFLLTAEWRGEHTTLQRYVDWAIELAAAGELSFSTEDMRAYFVRRAGEKYPAMHHSPIYRAVYLPAYRVVHVAYL